MTSILRSLITISAFLVFTSISIGQDRHINELLNLYDLNPQMISYHPDGEWLISTQSSGKNKSVLIHLKLNSGGDLVDMDTLNYGYYINISKLANDGDHLIYSFLDTLSQNRKTYKRSYIDGKFSEPVDIKAMSGIPTLTYFMMDSNEDIYYYTYDQDPNGIYLTRFINGEYQAPEILIPNRPNHVPFSPFLLDESTMILAQHGVEDKSVNGIYVSHRHNGNWQEPIKLDGLPYGWSIGIAPESNEILYLTSAEKRVEFIDLKDLKKKINKVD